MTSRFNASISPRSLVTGGRVLLIAALALARPNIASPQATASPAPAAPAAPAPPNSLLLLQQIEEGLAVIVKQANASVVTIEGRAAQHSGMATTGIAFIQKDEGGQKTKAKPDESDDLSKLHGWLLSASATGSGFIIEGGYVVTTAEVANRIEEPVAALSSGERVPLDLVKADKESNIALLKLSSAHIAGLKRGDSDRIQPGFFAITLGNQGGFANSISLGLISGKGRAGKSGEVRYNDLIQFQGIVGKGGSGSPLLDSHGEVIGMVVATSSMQIQMQEEQRSAPVINLGFSNTGFAIPSNEVWRVVDLLKKRVRIAKQGWLGVNLTTHTEESLKNPAKITGVYAGGPADRAGLRYGDVITMVNGTRVANSYELRALLKKLGAGEALRISLLREGKPLTLTATIEPRPDEADILQMRVIAEPDPNN